ncbi:MAG: glycosyltransferase family 2 protein [Gemmatimonadetes bacterium]|nr:glycosyltransferase family 2 protein [Gemmatimonadota bacterium]
MPDEPNRPTEPTEQSLDTTGVSVIVITRDEEHVIADCLESVRWADEIVVLDCGSTDRTVEICRSFTDSVYETDWPGFGIQKNRALSHATRDWVLSLDADEWVSSALAAEIQSRLPDTGANGLVIPFQSSYLGRFMRHGDWRNERHLRLFRRTSGRFSDDPVHERLTVDGEIGRLENPILHYSFATVEEVQDKVNRYSTAGAERRFASGKRSSLLKALSHTSWTFVSGYLLKAGFLDGREGFLLAVSNAEGSFYTYLKLLYLCEDEARESRGDGDASR